MYKWFNYSKNQNYFNKNNKILIKINYIFIKTYIIIKFYKKLKNLLNNFIYNII